MAYKNGIEQGICFSFQNSLPENLLYAIQLQLLYSLRAFCREPEREGGEGGGMIWEGIKNDDNEDLKKL